MAKKQRKARRPKGDGAVFWSEAKQIWRAKAIIGRNPDGSPLYKDLTGRTQAEALDKKRRAEEEARAGRITPAQKPMMLGEYLDHWLNNVSKPSTRETTWQSYERCVRLHIKPRLGGYKLGELRPPHIEQFFGDLSRDGMSAGNAKKVSEVLSSTLQHAVGTGMIPFSPAAAVAKPKPEEEEIVPFTPQEVKRIRQAIAGHRLEALFVLAIATGAREGELLGLAWEHLDLDAGTLRVERTLGVVKGGFILKEPKSKRGRRVVELPRFAAEAVQEHQKRMLSEGNISAPTVFCTKTGHYVSKSSFIRQVHEPLLKRAKVPYRKFHTFRHTHVSELLSRGVSVVDVARRIGDRPEVILKTYAHFLPQEASHITGRLDEMYG